MMTNFKQQEPSVQGMDETTLTTDVEQTVTYAEVEEPVRYEAELTPDLLNRYRLPETHLGNFLSRPVLISNTEWAHNGQMNQLLDAWHLFLEEPRIKDKINGYKLLRGTMNFRIVCNGQRFHQGLFYVGYKPMGSSTGSAEVNDDHFNASRTSQLPGPTEPINVNTSAPVEFSVPFMYPRNYIDIPEFIAATSSFDVPGVLHLSSLARLLTCNASIVPVYISVYAWLSDVELLGATEDTIQSDDARVASVADNDSTVQLPTEPPKGELRKAGPVELVASKFASAFGYLDDVPLVGKYAGVAKKAAKGVSSLASYFGFSRPIVMTIPEPFTNFPGGVFPHTSGGVTSVNLSYDPKQSIPMDHSNLNLGMDDPMTLRHIGRRWSYVAEFPWHSIDIHNDNLFEVAVCPNSYIFPIVTGEVMTTSLANSCMWGEYWTGTIEYRFDVISSPLQSGRISIAFDPSGTFFAQFPDVEQQNVVLDISKQTSVVIKVGWEQAMAYRQLSSNRELVTYSFGPGLIYPEAFSNGALVVKVVNELVGPDTVQEVRIAMSIRAGEDFQVQAPANGPFDGIDVFGTWDVQSDDITNDKSYDAVQFGAIANTENFPITYFGEREVSFRSLMKRFVTYNYGLFIPNDSLTTLTFPGFPGIRTLGGLTPTKNLMACLAPGFVGWRGSFNYRMMATSNVPEHIDIVGVFRREVVLAGYSKIISTPIFPVSDSGYQVTMGGNLSDGTGGGQMTDYSQQRYLQFTVPFYNPLAFCSTRPTQMFPDPAILQDYTQNMGFVVQIPIMELHK